MSDAPRVDVRLLDTLEAHLESHEMLGVDVGDTEAVLQLLARLEMGAVEALLPPALTGEQRERLLALVEHLKGQLPTADLPPGESVDRAEELRRARRAARGRS